MTTVCFVLESHVDAVLGGAEYQAHMLASEVDSRPGVSVVYLARNVAGANGDSSYSIRQVGNSRGFRGRAVLFDAPDLGKALAELRPDVIYQRMKLSHTGICASYARKAGIPLFFHVASDGDLNRRPRWRSAVNFPLDVLETMIGNWGVRHATHVIVQTERQQRLLAERFGREALALVKNFHPLPAVLPVKSAGPVRVLWVSNIHTYKRPELFVQLARVFASRADVQFQMVGRPDSGKRMEATMAAIAGQANVRFFGALPLKEVNRLMAEAHVFVNTSSVEGFPNTFVQAWGHGAVVVSLDIDIDGGLEAQGIGFRTGDLSGLRSTVDRLSRDPEERGAIAAKAFHYVHTQHSLRNAAALGDLMLKAGS